MSLVYAPQGARHLDHRNLLRCATNSDLVFQCAPPPPPPPPPPRPLLNFIANTTIQDCCYWNSSQTIHFIHKDPRLILHNGLNINNSDGIDCLSPSIKTFKDTRFFLQKQPFFLSRRLDQGRFWDFSGRDPIFLLTTTFFMHFLDKLIDHPANTN